MVHRPHRGGASLLPATSTSTAEAIHTSSTATSSTSQRQRFSNQLHHLRGQHSSNNIIDLPAQRAQRCNIVSLLIHPQPSIGNNVAAVQPQGGLSRARALNGHNHQPDNQLGIPQHGLGGSNGINVVVHQGQQLSATTFDRLQPHLQSNSVPRCIHHCHDPTSSHQESHQRMAQPVSSWHLQRVLQQQRRHPQQVASAGSNNIRQRLEPTRSNDGSSNIWASGCNISISISTAGNISTSSVSLSQPASIVNNSIGIWHVHHHQQRPSRYIVRHQVQEVQRRQRRRADGQHQRLSSYNNNKMMCQTQTSSTATMGSGPTEHHLDNINIEAVQLNAAAYGSTQQVWHNSTSPTSWAFSSSTSASAMAT